MPQLNFLNNKLVVFGCYAFGSLTILFLVSETTLTIRKSKNIGGTLKPQNYEGSYFQQNLHTAI